MRKTIVALSALAFVACAHSKKTAHTTVEEPQAPAPVAAAPQEQPAEIEAQAEPAKPPVDEAQERARRELESALATLADASVFFEFDSAVLTPEGMARLAPIGEVLARYPDLRVRVEGNCDERGTEQYNLVLGQQRADAAKTYLMRIGARSGQIISMSYGAERPRATGRGEDAWRQNRRDDIVLVDTPKP